MFRLTPAHVASRERWAMQRSHWRAQQWRRIVFTDETRFRLFKSDGRVRVWREPNQAYQSDCVQVNESQGISIHVWAGIALNGRTELVVLERNVTAETYAEVLQQHSFPSQPQSSVDCRTASYRMTTRPHTERLRSSSGRSSSAFGLCGGQADPRT